MADEKHNREENEALHKEEHIDLDELTEQSAPVNEADLSWLDNLGDEEPRGDMDEDSDLDAMIDEILNHIDPNDWEEWKEQPAREVSLPTPPAAATPQQPTPADDVPTGKARKKQRRSLPTNIAEGVIYVGGILLISFILATIGWRWAEGYLQLSLFSAALVGGLLGFLVYNHYPAKVFMGDTGSLFLGGAVSALAFAYDMPLVLILVGFVYLCETLSDIIQVTYFKLTHGKRVFKMAPLHHHFEMCGWKETKVVAVFASVSAVFCVLAYLGVMNRFGI